MLALLFVLCSTLTYATVRHPRIHLPERPIHPNEEPIDEGTSSIQPSRLSPDKSGPSNNQTIWDILQSNPDLFLAKRALAAAGMQSLLSGQGVTLTLFAPDNRAFSHTPKDLRHYFENQTHREILTGVSLNHIVHGHISSTKFRDGMPLSSVAGIPLHVLVRPLIDSTTIVSVNEATVISKDLNAANGVIHLIDSVLLPNKFSLITSTDDDKNTTLGQLLGNHHKLSIFFNALKDNDQINMLDDSSTDYTIFAPVNHAWHGAYLRLLDGNHNSELLDVLKYHIVPKQRLYSINFGDDEAISTYLGKSFRTTRSRFLSKDVDRLFVDNAEIIKINTIGRNGVIHFIDRVMLPQR